MPNVATKQSYPQLLQLIRSEIETARKRIEHTKALAYWRIGRNINRHILSIDGRAGYGEKVYKRLSRDLHFDTDTLRKTVKFACEYPNFGARQSLSWSHYRKLIYVKQTTVRRSLEKKAVRQNLSSRQLEREIKKHSARDAARAAAKKLTPKKGQLYTYTIDASLKEAVVLDCGFNVSREIPCRDAAKLPVGSIVQITGSSNRYTLSSARTKRDDLYTYTAAVEKIIDGDTLWAKIDLGLDTSVRQKLRLRGIDTPELGTPGGEKARRFVERTLKGLSTILIRTSTSDKYDRYLADVFYGKEETFLNQELLDKGLAVRMD